MEFTTIAMAKKLTGFTYLGSVSKTVKHKKSILYGEMTYSLYLSPARTSGYEVCPGRTKECTLLCLNESGMNTMNLKGEMINNSRIGKTKLFMENKPFFMRWMIEEIMNARLKAKNLGYKFSVRLNNTSDISPEDFIYGNKNILQIFPNTQFYDYTKVKERIGLMTKYRNYDLTYSYTGYNINECKRMLKNNIKVAVVFNKVPPVFLGHQVIDGDKNDLRYRDLKGVVIGLKFKRVRNKIQTNSRFVV